MEKGKKKKKTKNALGPVQHGWNGNYWPSPTQGHLLLRTSVCFHIGMPTTPAVLLKHMTHKTVSLSAKPSDWQVPAAGCQEAGEAWN